MHQLQMSVGIMMTVLMLLSGSGVHAQLQESSTDSAPDAGITQEPTPTADEPTEAPGGTILPEPIEPPAPPLEEATEPAPEVVEKIPADSVDEGNPSTGPPTGETDSVDVPISTENPAGQSDEATDPTDEDIPVEEAPAVEEPATGEGNPLDDETVIEEPAPTATSVPVHEEAPEIVESTPDASRMQATRTAPAPDPDLGTTELTWEEETLTVTVLDPDGNPLPRAFVTVRNDDWMLSGEGVTNAIGVVVLRDLGGGHAYDVEATALDGLRGAGTVIRNDNLDLALTIQMNPNAYHNDSVTLEALDFHRGEFVRGATYVIYDASGTLLHTITAGANERSIEVGGLAEGFHSVTVTADGYDPGYGQFFMPQASEVTVLIKERSSFSFSLTVFDSGDRSPVAGAGVEIRARNGEMMATGATDADGLMSTNLLNKGYAYEEYVVSVTHGSYLPASQAFTIDDPAQPKTMEIALEPVPPTTISAIDEADNGVPDASVTVIGAGGDPFSGQTGPDGTFPIAGLGDGDYTVTVTKDGYETGNATFTYPVQGPVIIQLVKADKEKTAYITFLVYDIRTGVPIAGATLIAVDRHEQFVTQGISGPDGSWTTKNDGTADSVLIFAPGYRVWRVLFPSPESGIESRSVPLFQLVTGVLVDDVTGEPIANAEIALWEPGSAAVRYTTTTDDGVFSFFFNPYPHGEVIRFRARSSPDYVTTRFDITMNSAVPFIELRVSPRTRDNDAPGNSLNHSTLSTSFTLCADDACAAPHDTSLDGSTVTWTVTAQDGSAFAPPGTVTLASAGTSGTGMTLPAQDAEEHTISAVLEGGVANGSIDLPIGSYRVCLQPVLTGADGSPIRLVDEAACDTAHLTADGLISGPLAFGAVVDGDVTVTQPETPAREQDDSTDTPTSGTDGDDADPAPSADAADAATDGTNTTVSALPSTGSGTEAASTTSWWLLASAMVLLLAGVGLRQRSRV